MVRRLAFLLLLCQPAFAQPALRERILNVENQRGTSDGDLAALKQGIASPDADTRRQAVRAIGRLERPELIPMVSRLLTDPNADVRSETVNAIGQMAQGDEGLAAAKTRLLNRARGEQTPRVRGVIAATLGRLPYKDPADVRQAEQTIAQMLPAAAGVANLDEVAGAVEGLEALIRLRLKVAAPSADTIARLRVASRMEGRPEDAEKLARIRRLATLALTAAGAVTRPMLDAGINDRDDEVRRITMVAARGDVDGRDAIVKRGLADPQPRVRYEALQTWGRGLQKTSCAPVLAALRDSNSHVMLLAIDLLGNGCPEQQQEAASALEAIAQTIAGSRGTWHAPARAIVSLAKVAPEQARALLSVYKGHAVWQVRMYAAHAAAALAAVDHLTGLARDENDNVREAALGELVTLKRPEAVALAIEALGRSDYQLTITAARALASTSARDQAIAALRRALERVAADRRDTARDARLAIVARLEELGSPKSNTAEERLPIPPVRFADIEALRNAGLRFVMRGKGSFELRLLVDEAPLSALRVATRAREGYYNGLTFHRVVANFVIQGGSPGANEYMGDAAFMRDEVGLITHKRGTVGISTRGRDTGDAQIFVNLVDLPRLDHVYTVFAEVVSGMDVVDAVLEGDVIERVEIVPPPAQRPATRSRSPATSSAR
jgi:cyclophilin family peptidyl-prolyl cis-trans isomerase/HEAT repeat protein